MYNKLIEFFFVCLLDCNFSAEFKHIIQRMAPFTPY